MKELRKIFKKIIEQHNKSLTSPNEQDIKVIGKGYFGVVFDFGNAVFKVTREGNYEDISNSYYSINYLAEQGVNCPQNYRVQEYSINMEPARFIGKLHESINSVNSGGDPEQFYKDLANIEQHNKQDKQGKLIGIFQEKIKGISPFTHFKNTSNYVDYLLQVPEEHLYKFILDANKLIQNNINIDNCNKSNFIYNKNNGFYFIDLAGQEYGVKCPFQCTVGNCLDSISEVYCINAEIAQKSLDVLFRLYEVIKKVYLGNLNDDYLKNKAKQFLKQKFCVYANIGKRIDMLPKEIKNSYEQKVYDIFKEIYRDLEGLENQSYYPQV